MTVGLLGRVWIVDVKDHLEEHCGHGLLRSSIFSTAIVHHEDFIMKERTKQ
jgi:hypothetical protein